MTKSDDDPAAALLMREVEEELKREQYLKIWKRYGGWIVGAAVAVVAIVAGYQGWQAWEKGVRAEEASRYAAAMDQVVGQPKQAVDALAALAADSHTGYATVARLRRAGLLAESGDVAGATSAFEGIVADDGIERTYRDLATVRLVLLTLDDGDPAQLASRLQALADGPWRHSALELSALLAQRQGDPDKARDIYRQLADDAATPQDLRARAAEMLAALGNDTRKG